MISSFFNLLKLFVILCVGGISLVGISESFAEDHHNELNYLVDYIDLDYNSATETFSINYSFDTNQQCSVKLSTMPRTEANHGYDFQTNWYPNYYTFNDGKLLHGEGRWYATLTEVIPCEGTLLFPKSNFTTIDESLYIGAFFYLSSIGANSYPGNEASAITSVTIHYFDYTPPYVFCGAWVDKDLVIVQGFKYESCNRFDAFPTQPITQGASIFGGFGAMQMRPPVLTINGYLHNGPSNEEETLGFIHLKKDQNNNDVTRTIQMYFPKTINQIATIPNIILQATHSYKVSPTSPPSGYTLDSSECKINITPVTTHFFIPSNNDVIVCDFHYNYNDSQPTVSELEENNEKGCADCIAPVLGTDNNGVLRVNDGITINGVTKDAGFYYTEYPTIYTDIGDENVVTLKYWENYGAYNIEMIQLSSVQAKGTSFGEAQWTIQVWLNNFSNDMYNPTIQEIIVVDPDNLLGAVNATVSLSSCLNNSSDPFECLSTEITFINDGIPDSPVLVAEAWDYTRSTMPTFFNEGLQVIDPNYVEPVHVEPYKSPPCNDKPLDEIMNGGTRYNCHFREQLPWFWQSPSGE